MDKLKPVFPFLLLLLLSLTVGCYSENDQSVLKKHEEKYPDLRKKYIYQSVIRLANINGDPDFNKLIKDVRKITIYLPPSEDSTYQIKDVSSGIRAEGFEQLMDVRNEDAGRISLWVKESKSSSKYMGFTDIGGTNLIFEIDGELDLTYLASIKIADQAVLTDLLK